MIRIVLRVIGWNGFSGLKRTGIENILFNFRPEIIFGGILHFINPFHKAEMQSG
jgi:hypothetical protein